MKKVSILTIIISSIIVGVITLSGEIKAQKDNLVVNETPENSTSNQNPDYHTVFSNFSCNGCFDEGDDLIGRDVKFKLNGVYMSISLIKLNKKTREFNTGYMNGRLFQNKVELFMPQDIVNEGLKEGEIIFTADKVKQTKDIYLLQGNAILTVSHNYINDTILTDEIIVNTK